MNSIQKIDYQCKSRAAQCSLCMKKESQEVGRELFYKIPEHHWHTFVDSAPLYPNEFQKNAFKIRPRFHSTIQWHLISPREDTRCTEITPRPHNRTRRTFYDQTTISQLPNPQRAPSHTRKNPWLTVRINTRMLNSRSNLKNIVLWDSRYAKP